MRIFSNYKIKDMVLKNRIVMPPMCLDSTDDTGMVQDFHFIHYTDRAIGGVGLIILEATAVAPNGRITPYDLGIWDDKQIEGLSRIVKELQKYGAKVAIQLAHAGRKCEVKKEDVIAPSSIAFDENYNIPREMTKIDIRKVIDEFVNATIRAKKAGFDVIEIHAAHGYLIHEFLSPVTNKRNDEYGGSIENRVRFLKELLKEVRASWGDEKPVILRVSATDYCEDGLNIDDMVDIVNEVKDFIDMVHVSSGGIKTVPINTYPGYQIKLSETIKKNCNIPTIAVGLITKVEQVEEILNNDRADLVALGRELLRNPYWVLNVAKENGIELDWPQQYKRAFVIRKSGF